MRKERKERRVTGEGRGCKKETERRIKDPWTEMSLKLRYHVGKRREIRKGGLGWALETSRKTGDAREAGKKDLESRKKKAFIGGEKKKT